MIEFLKGVWTFLLAAFSGFGNIICEKLFKKGKSKKHNQKDKSFSDKGIILDAIKHSSDFYQKQIFLRYFYKYKNNFSDEDVKHLTQQMEKNQPNYCVLLNILLGLIESTESIN